MTDEVRRVKVMKFGGTSVGAADRLRSVVEIVRAGHRTHRVVVIASALSGVTNRLVAALEGWMDPEEAPALVSALALRHRALAAEVLAPGSLAEYQAFLSGALAALEAQFHQLRHEGGAPAGRDAVLAAGERLAVPLVALALRDAGLPATAVDAAGLVRTDEGFGGALVDTRATYQQIRAWFERLPAGQLPVVTGYIGQAPDGRTTTLGRSGSDYSAALFATGLAAEVFERWTDVDGLYTEDPRTHAGAERLERIVLEEAWAWNQAGRLGMHRRALDPLVEAGIPVHIRSTARPDGPGTLLLPARQNSLAAAG